MIGLRETGWIGVDVGTCSIKLAQMTRVGADMRLASGVVVPRSHAVDASDMSSHDFGPLSIVQEVRAALDLRPDFKGRKAACVLSMPCQDLRTFTLPRGTERERRGMIANELGAAGVVVGDCEFDFWAGSSRDSTTEEVNVLSIPRQVAEGIVQDLGRVGLDCRAIDGLPFAMARAARLQSGARQRAPIATVDWGYSSATFCLVVDGHPQYCRNMRDCSVHQIMSRVQEGLGMSQDQLRHILLKYGLPDPSDDTTCGEIEESIADLTSDVLNEFCDQIEKTLNYLATRTAHAPQQISLSGGGATIRNVEAYLGQRLSVPVVSPNVRLIGTRKLTDADSDIPVALLANAMAVSSLSWPGNRSE